MAETVLEERVSSLEAILGHFISTTGAALNRLEREMLAFKDEMKEFKDKTENVIDELNKKFGDMTRKLGRL
ncbi:MAG: hypothetical protein N3A69_16510 [Leptospiraceae bacterium]|nr:hypothetical protein [Leptospiraceae bacterium]